MIIKSLIFITLSLLINNLCADEILIKKLISRLSSEEYKDRESSSQQLKDMGRPVLSFIKYEILNNPDIDIVLICESIYLHYYYVVDKNGDVPNIWSLENNIRFPKGFKIQYSKNRSLCKIETKKDVSVEYYIKAKLTIDLRDIIRGHNPYFLGNITNWQNEETARLAMRMYVIDILNKEQTKDLAQRIIDKSSNNHITHRNYYQTTDINNEIWDWWKNPPGPLVLRSEYIDPFNSQK